MQVMVDCCYIKWKVLTGNIEIISFIVKFITNPNGQCRCVSVVFFMEAHLDICDQENHQTSNYLVIEFEDITGVIRIRK